VAGLVALAAAGVGVPYKPPAGNSVALAEDLVQEAHAAYPVGDR